MQNGEVLTDVSEKATATTMRVMFNGMFNLEEYTRLLRNVSN
jgi:hypothetical protein